MWDIADFMEEFYGYRPVGVFTLFNWERYKEENAIPEWDYPLDEYKHIAELDIKCVPVRFDDIYGGYEYRWCEVPDREEEM